MSWSFDPTQGLIAIPTRISGPAGQTVVVLALDTGSSYSAISGETAALLGYDPASERQRRAIITGSGVEEMPMIEIAGIEALGQKRESFPVLCHTLPPSSSVEGVLGLDFFRDHRLTIDFPAGIVTLE